MNHDTVALSIGDRQVEVDVGIAPLVAALARRGIMTQGSCQRDHVVVGGKPVWSNHAYISFAASEDAARFVHRAAQVVDTSRVFSDVTTMIGRGNGFVEGWQASKWYHLPELGDLWAYGSTPWTTQSFDYTGVLVLVAFPTVLIETLANA